MQVKMLKSKKSKFDFTNNPILMLRTFRRCCRISISVCPFPLTVHLFLDKSDGGTGECQHWCPLLLLFSPVRITGSSLRTTEQMSVLSITVESHTSLLRVFLNGSSLFAPDIPHRLWSSVRVQGEKSICLAGWRGFSQNPQSDPRSRPSVRPSVRASVRPSAVFETLLFCDFRGFNCQTVEFVNAHCHCFVRLFIWRENDFFSFKDFS